MKNDFDLKIFRTLLQTLLKEDYKFYRFLDFVNSREISTASLVVLRHDVDRIPQNSLVMSEIEKSFGIKGTYYFRIVPESYDLKIMKKISGLGHEIGYHYEDVDLVIKNYKLKIKNEKDREILIDMAYESFCKNLELFRRNFEIKTICMHGSPRSKFDNKIIWEKYNYIDLGIVGEPYYDIDFNEFAYFTDTGRRWNGYKYSIRDKVNSKYNFDFKSTKQIIENIDNLPNKIMFTVHPERWSNNIVLWSRELLLQNMKNVVKRIILLRNK